MTEHLCVICKRRQYERAMVCNGDRHGLAVQLAEIRERYQLLPAALDVHHLDVIDLTLPARVATVHDEHHDQRGLIPAAALLDSWARDWIGTLPDVGEHLPAPTVPQLTDWLGTRLQIACDHHLAVDEFAREIRGLLASIRRALNRDLSPVRYRASCPYCGTRTLQREPGADWIECKGVDREEPGCGRLWGQDEYGLLARAAIHPDEMLDTGEAATLAEVEPALIRKWAQRGKITPEYDERGKPWYRKADVEEAALRRVGVASR